MQHAAAQPSETAKGLRLNKSNRAEHLFFINASYVRGPGVGRDLGVGVDLGVAVGVGVGVAVGIGVGVAVAVAVGVGLGAPDCAQYLPPVSRRLPKSFSPPQTIISVPVHTAV